MSANTHLARTMLAMLALAPMLLLLPGTATAYPEFQKWLEESSGRNVDCAYCHSHPDGPDGMKPGQLGSLDPEELAALSTARTAFEPGREIDSPILNPFGNLIIERVGKKRFLAMRQDPAALAEALDPASDLDRDGIPDAEEYRDGTHPHNSQSGAPMKLLWAGLIENRFHVFMLVLATVLGLFGLNNLLRWFELSLRTGPGGVEDEHESMAEAMTADAAGTPTTTLADYRVPGGAVDRPRAEAAIAALHKTRIRAGTTPPVADTPASSTTQTTDA